MTYIDANMRPHGAWAVAQKKVEVRESPAAIKRPDLSAVAFFVLTALAITAALFYLVPDVWWGL
jgi:hypothetical protein